jgi:hypothetical protein
MFFSFFSNLSSLIISLENNVLNAFPQCTLKTWEHMSPKLAAVVFSRQEGGRKLRLLSAIHAASNFTSNTSFGRNLIHPTRQSQPFGVSSQLPN